MMRPLRASATSAPARDALAAYLRAAARTSFAWREEDCGTWVSEWVHACRGARPVDGLSFDYSSAGGCMRAVERAGGLVAVADELAAALGIVRTIAPVRGDVACIETGGRLALAIVCGDGRFACRAPRGVSVVAGARVAAAWRVASCRP